MESQNLSFSISLLSVVFLALVIAMPELAFATTTTESLASFAQCSGPDCSMCNVAHLANGLIKWLIGFLFVIAACLIAFAGFKLVTSGGDRSALDDAKEMLTNAVIGMIIVLSAWLIVDTLMRGLVGADGHEGSIPLGRDANGEVTGWLFWSEVQCQENKEPDFNPYEYEDVSIIPATIPGPAGMPIPNVGLNCGFNESALTTIPGQGGHRVTPDTVNRFLSMKNMLASKGITLTVTSSYRSDARQAELWDECPRCQAEGTVARPCSRGGNGSRHSSGVALDLNSSGNRCDIINACRWAGASFIMTYERSGHVHCDWGSTKGERLNLSCPR